MHFLSFSEKISGLISYLQIYLNNAHILKNNFINYRFSLLWWINDDIP